MELEFRSGFTKLLRGPHETVIMATLDLAAAGQSASKLAHLTRLLARGLSSSLCGPLDGAVSLFDTATDFPQDKSFQQKEPQYLLWPTLGSHNSSSFSPDSLFIRSWSPQEQLTREGELNPLSWKKQYQNLWVYLFLFVYLWLRGLSLFVVSGGYSLQYLWLAEACGIFPDQGSNLCPPHYQADSLPLDHQGSPSICGCIFKPPHWIFKLLPVSPHCKFPLWYYPWQWSFVHILDSCLRNKPWSWSCWVRFWHVLLGCISFHSGCTVSELCFFHIHIHMGALWFF